MLSLKVHYNAQNNVSDVHPDIILEYVIQNYKV